MPQVSICVGRHHVGTMATKAQLEARLELLNNAIARGVRSVTIGGQTVIYNTTDSLVKARDDVQKQLNGLKPRRSSLIQLYQSNRAG